MNISQELQNQLDKTKAYFECKGFKFMTETFDMGDKLGAGITKDGYRSAVFVKENSTSKYLIRALSRCYNYVVKEGINHGST